MNSTSAQNSSGFFPAEATPQMSLSKISEASSAMSHTSSEDINAISFDLQSSLFRETMLESQDDLDKMTMEDLNTRASVMLNKKFPDASASYPTLGQRLLLYRHEPKDPNILQLVTSPKQICAGDVIEIVLSVEAAKDKVNISKHVLVVHSYKGPTFCDYCDEFLWGLVKQGLKCTACGKNFHKRCVYHIPNDCEGVRRRKRPSSNDNISLKGPSYSQSSIASSPSEKGFPSMQTLIEEPSAKRPSVASANGSLIVGRPIEIDWKYHSRPRVPHSFLIHTYPPNRPTQCKNCRKLLKGISKQGLQCRDCKYNACKLCVENGRVPEDCPGDIQDEENPDVDMDPIHPNSSQNPMIIDDGLDTPEGDSDTIEDLAHSMHNNAIQERDAGAMIPLIRVAQSMRNTKRKMKEFEGWLIHFTSHDDMRRRHFWRLDGRYLTLYQDQQGPKFYKQIQLASILNVSLKDTRGVMHLEIICSPDLSYYIADDTSVKQTIGLRDWHNLISKALNPVLIQNPEVHNQHVIKKQLSNIMSLDPEEKGASDVEQIYQIFRDEVLGSGQFGIVYAAKHRRKPLNVAIKVVDKTRFPNKESNQLIHEVQILAGLHHPGIVKLFNMFENQQQIFVVMEKLQGDMLEMILSSERGRLDERITKFLITQILDALRYLHLKNIVHCDLKPENVLTANTDFSLPQVKLCDFGFARIIGEKSFRRSVVGTPAYLAPEVLSNQGYNRTLDMWSVGVIIYVSLSGTFPFNEDEDILDQIQNAEFMFPDTPWKSISSNAIDLIKHLLQVKRRRRLTVERALLHDYFKDYQCFLDLKKLEERIGLGPSWTVNEHWAQVAAKYGKAENPSTQL
jgi:protein kinase D